MMQIIFQEYKHFIGIILHITNGVHTALLPRQDRNQSREFFSSLVPGFPPAHSVPVEREPEKKGVSLLFPRNTLMAA